jgi:hypothetical protein
VHQYTQLLSDFCRRAAGMGCLGICGYACTQIWVVEVYLCMAQKDVCVHGPVRLGLSLDKSCRCMVQGHRRLVCAGHVCAQLRVLALGRPDS